MSAATNADPVVCRAGSPRLGRAGSPGLSDPEASTRKLAEEKKKQGVVMTQERIVLILALAALPFLVFYIQEVIKFLELRKEHFPGVVFPKLTDFLPAIYAAAIILFLRWIMSKVFLQKWADVMVVRQVDWDDSQLTQRRDKFRNCSFLVFYYIFATWLGWYVLKDKSWVPSVMVPGAHGVVTNCWIDFWQQEQYEDVKFYYMLSLGYALQSLVYLIARKHRRDFLEMALHHILEIALISYSYLYGYSRIGTLVLIVHDVGDILINITRAINDARYTKTTVCLFASLLVSWIYFRLWLFPCYIIHSTMMEAYDFVKTSSKDLKNEGFWFFNFMLCALLVLHVFWFIMFLKMGYNAVVSHQVDDVVDQVESDPSNSNGAAASSSQKKRD